MNPPIPLVMRIVILFDWRMEYFLCLIGPKNSHPKLNWMAIYSHSHWLQKDEEAIDQSKGFRSFHWTRETNSRKVMEAYQEKGFFGVWGKRKKEEDEVGGIFQFLCVERCSWKRCVQESSMEGSYVQQVLVAKPLDFLFNQLFLPNPPLDLCQI